MVSRRTLIHIVTWNSASTIGACIESVFSQKELEFGVDFELHVTDNASSDDTASIVKRLQRHGLTLQCNADNLGFSGGQNQCISRFLDGGFDALLILNPDIRLQDNAVSEMARAVFSEKERGMVTPKLLRADPALTPIKPAVLDAAGMVLTPALRHLDRGSGELDVGQFDTPCASFGGTGACLLIKAECVRDLLIPRDVALEEALFEIYPQLRGGAAMRLQLFDEAFFAYREDADLAWRAYNLGWSCWYEPAAVGYHVRRVTPERRSKLPPELNLFGVRNRFLLQLNNWNRRVGIRSFLEGVLCRNILVIGGVLLKERSSLDAFRHVRVLFSRARKIHRHFSMKSAQRSPDNGYLPNSPCSF